MISKTKEEKCLKSAEFDLQLTRCFLAETSDAVLCQIFAFLNVREHWKLSRGSNKMEKVSLLPQASPVLVDILSFTSDSNIDTGSNQVQRLLNFRPTKLLIPMEEEMLQTSVAKMTNLRELTVGSRESCGTIFDTDTDTSNMVWMKRLTRLCKLRMPEKCLNLLNELFLPDSLTELDLFNDGYCRHLNIDVAFRQIHLRSLQVLKLPNSYYPLRILKVGEIFPQLRELRFGYLNVRNKTPVSFDELKSCANLEALSIGIDSNDSISRWETLAPLASLRRLTICIYNDYGGLNMFAGLSQLTQLTHLKLVSHPHRPSIVIFDALNQLTSPSPSTSTILIPSSTLVQSAITNTSYANLDVEPILPRLTTFSLSNEIILGDSSCLSAFSALTDLELPDRCTVFLHLHHLHTLRVSKNQAHLLHFYKDQVVTVVYKDFDSTVVVDDVRSIRDSLLKMTKLATLKIQPRRNLPVKKNKDKDTSTTLEFPKMNLQLVAEFFRSELPATVKIEIDYSTDAD